MERAQVKDHFRVQANEYEGLMRRIVPGYDLQTALLIDLIPFSEPTPIRVLDLGSGPGTLSELVLERYRRAEVVAFDLTEEMLDAARERCHAFGDRFLAVEGDFSTDDFGCSYDVILAGLALHHLEDEQRRQAFRRIFAALRPGGVFLVREVTAEDDSYIADWHYRLWRAFMSANGEDGGFWFRKHLQKDHPISVRRQLRWLIDTGFQHVACHWRYLNFAILGAHKTSTTAEVQGVHANAS